MKNLKWLLIIAAVFFVSCSSVKKAFTNDIKKTDSIGTKNIHQNDISVTDSTELKKTDQQYKNSINIVFDTDTAGLSIISPEDSAKVKTVKYKPPSTIYIGGQKIVSSEPIKSIDITIAGQSSTVDLFKLLKKDSVQTSDSELSDVQKFEKNKIKMVQRTGQSTIIYIGLALVILAFVGYEVYKKYIV